MIKKILFPLALVLILPVTAFAAEEYMSKNEQRTRVSIAFNNEEAIIPITLFDNPVSRDFVFHSP